MKANEPKKKRLRDIEYTESSGNVFADLEITSPEEAMAKAKIAMKIYDIIKKKKLTPSADGHGNTWVGDSISKASMIALER